MSRKAVMNADVEKCRLSVVNTDEMEPEDATPEASWGRDRLVAYSDAQLTVSGRAEQESLLQACKSAVALFWAGCALYFIRADCKATGRGEWTKLKRERGWKDSTANDAIRLYEKAKTPDAMSGLGITEAKAKYVYPFKDSDLGDDEPDTSTSQAGIIGSTVCKPKKGRRNPKGPVPGPSDQHDHEETPPEEEKAGGSSVGAALAKELEEIAQRLTEIALNDLGKVEDVKAMLDAIAAVSRATDKLLERTNERLPDE